MSKMKDYYEFLQMLYRLDTDALRVMLEYECDDFRRQLIEGEIGARSLKRWSHSDTRKTPRHLRLMNRPFKTCASKG